MLERCLQQADSRLRRWVMRLGSMPNVLLMLWILLLLWGERGAFTHHINACRWRKWEQWPADATPHHLVFVADPQLIDPHSYPGRPRPLSGLTVFHTDYYMRRAYQRLLRRLEPDSLVFLGDLFDGGREWKTAQGNTEDPAWAAGLRPSGEQVYVESWRAQYGQDFWLREYARFGDMFYQYWNRWTPYAQSWQRGRRILATIPGNHDLGFGAQIKLPVRKRFEAYFGNGNRVDVIGNHTLVSVDTVSLSAHSSDRPDDETIPIAAPVEDFLANVASMKQRATTREIDFFKGQTADKLQAQMIEELDDEEVITPIKRGHDQVTDLPTILLSHVPLYREPGTPCGASRERWPPTKPPRGQREPVIPDDANAISVTRGYQYQNVLSEQDSIKLVSSIGNVVSVFSGDDHDYCEIIHPPNKNHAREITVKSINYAMGIRRPGFVMVSMWNPILEASPAKTTMDSERDTKSLNTPPTIQTHLCLLPDQIGILIRYGVCALLTVLLLVLRALLPAHYDPFIIRNGSLLPTSIKDLSMKASLTSHTQSDHPTPFRDNEYQHHASDPYSSTSSTSSAAKEGLAPRSAAARTRSVSPGGYGLPVSAASSLSLPPMSSTHGMHASHDAGSTNVRRWQGEKARDWDDGARCRPGGGRKGARAVVMEVLGGLWRIAWPSVVLFVWLNMKG